MSGDNDKWSLTLAVCLDLLDGCLVHHYFLVYCCEYFVQKPGEETDRTHRVVAEHCYANLLCDFGQLFLGFVVGSRRVLQFHHILLNGGSDGVFDCLGVEYKKYSFFPLGAHDILAHA